ncbi:MAG: acyl-CoA dehydrogenase family protein [Micrococcus sp.]|nr:acyl-CoA dehydrogenase family protein [Micrococcus sp.]
MNTFIQDVRARGLEEAERQAERVLEDYREAGLCGALVPTELGGLGWSASEAVRLLGELGSTAPSAAIGVVMHNFSIAGLAAAWRHGAGTMGELLISVADQGLFVSSGFAELGLGSTLTRPSMTAVRRGEAWAVNGVKRPCSLSRSMDLLTASVWLEDDEHGGYAVAIIPAGTEGISVERLWSNHVLEGAQSDAVVLQDVIVKDTQLVRPDKAMAAEAAVLQVVGMNWFLLMIMSAYLGMARRLTSELVEGGCERGGSWSRARRLSSAVEGCELSVVAFAARMEDAGQDPHRLQDEILSLRAAVEVVLSTVAAEAPQCMCGTQFIGTSMISRLRESLSGLQFHPPAREIRYRAAEA